MVTRDSTGVARRRVRTDADRPRDQLFQAMSIAPRANVK